MDVIIIPVKGALSSPRPRCSGIKQKLQADEFTLTGPLVIRQSTPTVLTTNSQPAA